MCPVLFLAPRKRWCWMAYNEWTWIALTVRRGWIRWKHCGRPWPNASTIHSAERTFSNWPFGRNQMAAGNGFTASSGRRGREKRTPPAPPFIFVATAVTQPHAAPRRLAATPRRSPRQYALRVFWVASAFLFGATVPPFPSVGADVPVDASSYRLDTHPLIDAADTPAHCWCFWHDCCTAPTAGAVGLGTRTRQTKLSQMVLGALSASCRPQRPTHTTSEHRIRRDREGIDGVSGHQLSFHITPSQTTRRIHNNISHQQ
ncbi:hypothetical protein C3747_93g143 [Trypanosoma cruzi]|uniref:Uncharacterized protein n=1 Tax=Trypanosoma cruzi TaxID=5693 RepID=A0A2V2WHW5_TRYCR|nr:hypothetical protein C3747_93g143 [Trypanosoma cruzi]